MLNTEPGLSYFPKRTLLHKSVEQQLPLIVIEEYLGGIVIKNLKIL
jgi:hypothetical protein